MSYSYQWVRNDGSSDMAINDATGSTYMLVAADQGKTVKVRVSFTDDKGNAESLTSAATAAVAGPALTVTITSRPASHDGTGTFTFEMSFSEEPQEDFSYETLRDHAFTVTGGGVTKAGRMSRPSNISWRITIRTRRRWKREPSPLAAILCQLTSFRLLICPRSSRNHSCGLSPTWLRL